jgi:hypothetical protein
MKFLPTTTAALVAVLACAPASATSPMNRTVQDNAYQQLDYFFAKLVAEREGMVLDGASPFKSGDKFLPGKVAAGLGHVLLNTAKDDPSLERKLKSIATSPT